MLRYLLVSLLLYILNIVVLGQTMNVYLKGDMRHSYQVSDIDSVTFIEKEEVLEPIESGTELMLPEMLSPETLSDYYTLTDRYLKTEAKDLKEYNFYESAKGQYALMPIDKSKMIKLYGGGKYLVEKRSNYHAEALYDENLNLVHTFSTERKTAVYENKTMSYTVDLTDKEGIYYLRRIARIAYADKMSVKVLKEFQPQVLTSYSKRSGLSLSLLDKRGDNYVLPITKSLGRVAFDFVINEDCNINAPSLNLVQLEMIDSTHTISILRRQPEQLRTKYYGDADDVIKADVQELRFRCGFVVGTDTIIRSADYYKPLAGKPCMYIWLKGQEFSEEPTEAQLLQRAESLADYQNYSASIMDGQLCLYNGNQQVVTIPLKGKSLLELKNEMENNDALKDFTFHIFEGCEQLPASELMTFDKIKLVGNYYQGYNLSAESENVVFDYHLDSYPLPLRQKIDNTTHTFEAIFSNDGVYAGIDGNYRLMDYNLVKNVLISNSAISISNIDIEDGATSDFFHKFSGKTRISNPYIMTQRSPYLLGLMGHLVKANSAEGQVDYPASDVSSARLDKMCDLMKSEGYETLSMDQLVEYMDKGMNYGRYAFFMFDDFRFSYIWEEVSTRNIFLSHSQKANLALIHKYLWDDASERNKRCREYIAPMREIGWNCVSHSLRHNMPTGKKCSVALDYELRQIQKEAKEFGFNKEVFVYNWDGTWEPSDVLFQKNGFKYAINSRGTNTIKATNPFRLGRTSYQESLPWSTIDTIIKW